MNHIIKKSFILLLSSLLLQGCFFQEKNHEDTRFVMDTIVSIQTTGKDEKALTEATNKAFTLFQTIADETDSYTAQGDDMLFAINSRAGQGPQKAAPHLYNLLKTLQPLHHEDAISLTLGPAISLWNRHKEAGTVPTKDEVAAALDASKKGHYELSDDQKTLTLDAGTQLDLGAVAKGYAVEQVSQELAKDKNITSALINAGGNIKVIGKKPDGKPWRIGVQDPVDAEKLLGTLTVPSGTAIATSGDYQRYYEVNGVRYHHILDPKTGWPARRAHAVTVVTKSATMSDYYSTMLFVMTPEAAMKFVEATPDLEMIYVAADGTITVSSGLKDTFSQGS
jgi:thiamine biosynthesis lipoprotein